MIDFGNHCCIAQILVLSLGTCCPLRDPSLLVSCSLVPHHVIPEGSLEEHGRNFWRVFLLITKVSQVKIHKIKYLQKRE